MIQLLLIAAFLAPQQGDKVHIDPSGEVTLDGDRSKMIEHADPSKWHVITDMVVYKGRLLASAAHDFETNWQFKEFAYSKGAQLLEFDPGTNRWKVVKDSNESIWMNIRVVAGKLMIPEFYPLNGRPRIIHTFDGETWGKLGLLPKIGWHAMEVAEYKGRIYASGSWRSADPNDQKNDPNWWYGYGRMYESADGGKTWKLLRQTRGNGRILDMVEVKGKLYANDRGLQLLSWDGKKFEEIPVQLKTKKAIKPKVGNAWLTSFAGKVVVINTPVYYTYNGKTWKSYTPGYIDLWVEGKSMYGLREDGTVWITKDAAKWKKVTKTGVPKKEFDRKTGNGRRPLHRGSVCVHRGRLFVGTGAEGKIYASLYQKKGWYVSKAVERDQIGPFTVNVDTAAPDGTKLRLKVRTAQSEGELASARWKNLGDKVSPPQTHSWVQFRAEFESNGRATPVLRSFRIVEE